MDRTLTRLLKISLLLAILISPTQKTGAAPPPPPGVPPNEAGHVIEAVQEEVTAAAGESTPAAVLYETRIDHVRLSEDQTWASAWLTPLDPQTGEPVPVEPGLAMVQRTAEGWQAILPGEAGWREAVENAPESVLPAGEKEQFLIMEAQAADLAATSTALRGYLLPWKGGESMYLTQSVHHDAYTPSGNAHFAFDFATIGGTRMFSVYAAKAGTVYLAKDSCENGSETCSNYLVLKDASTDPVTYQLYLHFAQGSIPPEFKMLGTPVYRGQFIGIADDTGASSNHHLHFHVHTYPASWWGPSVDITFEDVDINGGRPRTTILNDGAYCKSTDVCDSFRAIYTSENYGSGDRIPPEGGILSPLDEVSVFTRTMDLKGWVTDNSGVAQAQFIAGYGGSWHDIGAIYTGSGIYTSTWNLCDAGVPDGPVSLALRLQDMDGNLTPNLPGLRHLIKQVACQETQPACTFTADQVVLYSEPDYRGDCLTLGKGSFTSLGAVGSNRADSIRVGANVQATLFEDDDFRGRGETFASSDSGLADNRAGANRVSSVKVQARTDKPAVPLHTWPENNAHPASNGVLYLTWENLSAAQEYQAQLTGSATLTSPWQEEPAWSPGALPAGAYQWKVRARNAAGESAWSTGSSFILDAPVGDLPEPVTEEVTLTAPFSDDMESDANVWTASNYWDKTDTRNHTADPEASISWMYDTNALAGYDTGFPTAGHLTSPEIAIPAGGYFLRFWYYAQTEVPTRHYDRRRVQISANGGPFVDVLQLADDPPAYWLQSPALDLSAYAGKVIQVRFRFETVDERYNAYEGWFIDDFSITKEPPPECGNEPDGNDSPETAATIAVGASVQGEICPGGDLDYFRFSGKKGQQIGAAVQAQADGSQLDSYLYLLDGSDGSELARNDDMVLYQQTDSFVSYRLSRDGEYLLKLRAWDHPTAGGSDYTYTLRLAEDTQNPVISEMSPRSGSLLPASGPFSVTLTAQDGANGVGINRVSFWWHSGDWLAGDWQAVETITWDGGSRWSFSFDPAAEGLKPEGGMAFYAQVVDWAGNWTGAGRYHLMLPETILYMPLVRKGP